MRKIKVNRRSKKLNDDAVFTDFFREAREKEFPRPAFFFASFMEYSQKNRKLDKNDFFGNSSSTYDIFLSR